MKKAPVVGFVAVAALALSACGGGDGGQASSGAETDLSLVLAIEDPPAGGWDPIEWSWDSYPALSEAAYDSLIHQTGSEYEPGLAVEWGWDTPTEFSMTLREGLTFDDGAAFDSSVVAANLERFKASNNRFASLLAPMTDIVEVSDHELTLEFTDPVPDLEMRMSQYPGMMVSPSALEDPSLLAEAPQGISPYLLNAADSTNQVRYVFERNAEYWGVDSFPYETLTFEIQSDRHSSFNAMRSDQVNVMRGTPENVDAAQSAGLGVHEVPGTVLAGVFNDRRGEQVPALAETEVRQAMSHAVNREAIAAELLIGEPAHQIFTDETDAYVEDLDDAYPYDLDRARELLEEAGYGDGFTMDIATFGDLESVATAMAADWAEIGIDVNIQTMTGAELVPAMLEGRIPFAITRQSSTGTFSDVEAMFTPEGGRNASNYEFSDIAPLFEGVLYMDEDEQFEAYQAIGRLASDEAYSIPVVRETFFFFHDDTVNEMAVPGGQSWLALRSLAP